MILSPSSVKQELKMNIHQVYVFNNRFYLISLLSIRPSANYSRKNLLKLLLHCINLFHSAASVPLCLPSEVLVWHGHQSGGGAGRLLRGRGVRRQTECDGSTQPSRDTGSHFPQTRSTMMRLTSSSCRRFHTMSLPASAARALF